MLEESRSLSYDLQLEGNDYFNLSVKNTCENVEIKAAGIIPATIEKTDASPLATPFRVANKRLSCEWISGSVKTAMKETLGSSCVLTPKKVVEITHNEMNSGYLIKIRVSKNGKPVTGYDKTEWENAQSNALKSSGLICEQALNKIVKDSGGTAVIGADITDKNIEKQFDAIQVEINQKIRTIFGSLKGVPLTDVDLVVNARTKKWNTEFSGGVVVSSLTDRRFNVIDSDDGSRIVRNQTAEDEQQLILGAFTHVYHSDWNGSLFGSGTPAISAGIAVNDGSSLDYFIGPSFKFGSAMINFGYHWGQVSKLPGNLPVDTDLSSTVDETRILLSQVTEQSQTDRGWYISVSFTFAGQGASPIKSALAFPEPENE